VIDNFRFFIFGQYFKGGYNIFWYRAKPAGFGIDENPVGFAFDKNGIVFGTNDPVFAERLYPAKVGYPRQNDNLLTGERGA
jgi:hypothetical protein